MLAVTNLGVTLRLLILVPVFIAGGIYCWRYGIRWSANTTIKGTPAKFAAIFLFVVAGAMLLAAIFPTQAEHLVDSLEQR
jgi:hypothetical protein